MFPRLCRPTIPARSTSDEGLSSSALDTLLPSLLSLSLSPSSCPLQSRSSDATSTEAAGVHRDDEDEVEATELPPPAAYLTRPRGSDEGGGAGGGGASLEWATGRRAALVGPTNCDARAPLEGRLAGAGRRVEGTRERETPTRSM